MATTGSSPLARGLRAITVEPPRRPGIIPARVGFTSSASSTPSAGPDHPRSRGVYPTVWVGGQCGAGSSPLARGLHEWEAERPDANRIIPARAGFTTFRMTIPPGKEDHPRSRGVYEPPPGGRGAPSGSSPLARGLLEAAFTVLLEAGIIPARAGFTRRPLRCRLHHWDHPRSRGVYPCPPSGASSEPGSSPLARGLHSGVRGAHLDAGIIPARAGFTSHRPRQRLPGQDHPRSRGVYRQPRGLVGHRGGSSPLARGLRPKGAPRRG